jgi:hypothetical protein
VTSSSSNESDRDVDFSRTGGIEVDVSVTVTMTDEDLSRLRTSLGPSTDLERIARALSMAGATELLAQATGRVVPGGMREARLYRIYLLLQSGITLEEAQTIVASIFKETPARARALVESAIARYDIELRKSVVARVAELLDKGVWANNTWNVELPVGFVRDRVLEASGQMTSADPTRAGRGSVYRFPDEPFQAVRKVFGLKSHAKPRK